MRKLGQIKNSQLEHFGKIVKEIFRQLIGAKKGDSAEEYGHGAILVNWKHKRE